MWFFQGCKLAPGGFSSDLYFFPCQDFENLRVKNQYNIFSSSTIYFWIFFQGLKHEIIFPEGTIMIFPAIHPHLGLPFDENWK